MNIKQETAEQILLEGPDPFYALYNVYEKSLKIIDGRRSEETELSDIRSIEEAFKKLDQMDQEDLARQFQRGQQELFFMDGDTDG